MPNGEEQHPPDAEVFSQPPPDLTAITTVAPAAVEVDAFVKAAAHLQMFDKLRDIALRLTRPTDWHFFGDRPWPMRGAVEKIQRALGLNLTIHRENGSPYSKRMAQDDLGGYYIITVSGTIKGEWGELEAMGFCSSRDQFFAYERGELKPLSQVKEEHLIQAAYTNFVANAVMRYTGISGFTKEDLERVYGVGKVSQHTYATDKEKKTTTDTADRSAKMKELGSLCMVMAGGIESEAADLCADLSAFTSSKDGKQVPGKRSPRDLTDGRLNVTLQSARKRWEEFLKEQGDQAGFFTDLLKQRMEGKAQEGGKRGDE